MFYLLDSENFHKRYLLIFSVVSSAKKCLYSYISYMYVHYYNQNNKKVCIVITHNYNLGLLIQKNIAILL